MKKYQKMMKRVICLVLTTVLLGMTGAQSVSAETFCGDTESGKYAISLLDDGFMMPQGGIKAPAEFTEQEIAANEMSCEDLFAYAGIDSVDVEQAELELEADLMSLSDNTVSANTISGNDTVSDMISAETLGYATMDDAIAYVKKQMVKRRDFIIVRLARGRDSAQRNMQKILAQSIAYDENGAPNEGDYLYWNFNAYRWSQANSNSSETVTYYVSFSWRTDASEENYVSKRVAQIVQQLGLKNSQKSDYEKVKQIYDFIMDTVDYDYYHFETNLSYMPMYTAYTALHDGTAVCQAYALLFYRLCHEVGISARLIAGNDDYTGNPTHGWNIVRIGEYYYNVDATWDDETASRRAYFLKNKADFTGHTRNKKYSGSAFEKQFPLAEVSYSMPEAIKTADDKTVFASKSNLAGTLTTMSGMQFSLAAQGNYKILYFLNGMESGSGNAVKSIGNWRCLNQPGCEIAIIDVLSDSDYEPYRQWGETVEECERRLGEYTLQSLGNPSNVSYVLPSEINRTLQAQYARLMGGTAGPICCGLVIDTSNQVRCWYEGGLQADGLADVLQSLQTEAQVIASAGNLTLKQKTNNQVSVSWKAVSGAQRYYVYRKNGTGDYACVGTTKKTTYVNEIPGKGSYTYVVYASDGTRFTASYKAKSINCKTIYAKKGKTYTVDGCKYKILKSSASAKTCAFAGVTTKSVKTVTILDSVKIDGLTYKVTEIANNALKGKTNLKTVSVGGNVTKIGQNAFYGCKKLVQIVVQGKKIKSVGSNAFRKTGNKAYVYVPSSALNKYRKLFAGKGLASNAKIKK